MKTSTCDATMVKMKDGSTRLSLNYCVGTDCTVYPCPHAKKWLKRYKILKTVPKPKKEGI